jgi:hypothetical protein
VELHLHGLVLPLLLFRTESSSCFRVLKDKYAVDDAEFYRIANTNVFVNIHTIIFRVIHFEFICI